MDDCVVLSLEVFKTMNGIISLKSETELRIKPCQGEIIGLLCALILGYFTEPSEMFLTEL